MLIYMYIYIYNIINCIYIYIYIHVSIYLSMYHVLFAALSEGAAGQWYPREFFHATISAQGACAANACSATTLLAMWPVVEAEK